jgi:hypothetical protein
MVYLFLSKRKIKQQFHKIVHKKTRLFQDDNAKNVFEKYKFKKFDKNRITQICLVFCKCKKSEKIQIA